MMQPVRVMGALSAGDDSVTIGGSIVITDCPAPLLFESLVIRYSGESPEMRITSPARTTFVTVAVHPSVLILMPVWLAPLINGVPPPVPLGALPDPGVLKCVMSNMTDRL